MVEIRDAKPSEFDQVGKLLVDIYSTLEDFPSPEEQPEYYQKMGDVAAWKGIQGVDVIVAVDDGRIVAGVIFFSDVKHYGSGGTITSIPNASGFRLLGVSPQVRGKGIGRRITLECIRRAIATSKEKLLIHSTLAMDTAWKMYERMGFKRFPEIDFCQEGLEVFGFQFFLTNRYFPRIAKSITTDIIEKGNKLNSIQIKDLMPYDECHSRGAKATVELTKMQEFNASSQVLDIGCGIGGTCRYLAKEFGCQMTGIEINASYVASAKKLNDLVGLGHQICVQDRNALKMSKLNQQFDVAISQHATMNIKSKLEFFQQLSACVKTGGHYVYHEVFSANESPDLLFPLPWSDSANHSHLVTHDDFQSLAEKSGFQTVTVMNRTAETTEHFAMSAAANDLKHPARFFLGSSVKEKAAKYYQALKSRQLAVYMGKLIKTGEE